jgi:hypothetical protein
VSQAAPGAAPAVLVLACRRPEFTGRLLRFLVDAGVRDIHVVVDGPKDSPGDAALVERTREVVRGFDLPKDRLWLREANLGGPRGVPEAIDWFFGARDRGIILEDDLLPDPSFIRFAAELLQRYESEPRGGAIHPRARPQRIPTTSAATRRAGAGRPGLRAGRISTVKRACGPTWTTSACCARSGRATPRSSTTG